MISVTVTDRKEGLILAHAVGPDEQARDLVLAAVEQWMLNLTDQGELTLVGIAGR